MKLIDYHKLWCETGKLPSLGLCSTLIALNLKEEFKILKTLIKPNVEELPWCGHRDYWGCCTETIFKCNIKPNEYTPFRQTIVLLICAIKNEI